MSCVPRRAKQLVPCFGQLPKNLGLMQILEKSNGSDVSITFTVTYEGEQFSGWT